MGKSILIFGISFADRVLAKDWRGQRRDIHNWNRWVSLHSKINSGSGAPLVLVDSATDERLFGDLNFEFTYFRSRSDELFDYCIHDKMSIVSFASNVGHCCEGRPDGCGRAIMQGIRLAEFGGFDWAVHVESDCLLRVDINEIINEMENSGAEIAMAWSDLHKFPEVNLIVCSTQYSMRTNLIGKYDWNRRRSSPIPETRFLRILGKDLWTIGLYGDRDEDRFSYAEIVTLDYLTHTTLDKFSLFCSLGKSDWPRRRMGSESIYKK